MSLKGLIWDNPRGYQALQASLDWKDCPVVQWDIQLLSGFEENPLEELADQYDLLVIDHPHLGQAVESQCL
jgi:multiple sugar transport system substrate-binding protein